MNEREGAIEFQLDTLTRSNRFMTGIAPSRSAACLQVAAATAAAAQASRTTLAPVALSK